MNRYMVEDTTKLILIDTKMQFLTAFFAQL